MGTFLGRFATNVGDQRLNTAAVTLALNTALRDLTMFRGWEVNVELTHSDAQEDDNGVVKGLVRLVSVRSSTMSPLRPVRCTRATELRPPPVPHEPSGFVCSP